MFPSELLQIRLQNQHISHHSLDKPADIVRWFGAVQAQDYDAAKWALGLRLPNTTDAAVEQAITDGTILRTHIMRPTWHFVTPEDIRWMQILTSHRVNAASSYWHRKLELDDATFALSNSVIAKALQDNNYLTRAELIPFLEHAGIPAVNERLPYLMGRAEIDSVVCSGPKRGKQFTYALIEERVPPTSPLEPDEALTELTRRYFTAHGPATLQDFVWWSGLTASDARIGIELAKAHLLSEVINGVSYWFSDQTHHTPLNAAQVTYLLPDYDEYIVGYTDRKDLLDPAFTEQATSGNLDTMPFLPTIVTNGQVEGSWKRIRAKNASIIEFNSFIPISDTQMQALQVAAERYSRFLSLPVTIQS